MPQLTLNAKQVRKLSAFCKKHNNDNFFMAKDTGAYVGATGGSHEDGTFENCIFYFKGMDPTKSDDAYDNARYAFGGDDFGETFDTAFLHKLAAEPNLHSMTVKVSASSIKISAKTRKVAA